MHHSNLKWHRTLFFKSMLQAALLSLAVIAGISWVYIQYQQDAALKRFEMTNHSLVDISSTALKLPLWNFANQQAQFLLDGLSKSQGFCGAKVTDSTNKILAATAWEPARDSLTKKSEIPLSQSTPTKIYSSPIRMDDPTTEEETEVTIGAIHACYDASFILEALTRQQHILAAAIIFILAGLMAIWGYSFRILLRPLDKLGKAMEDTRMGLRHLDDPGLLGENEIGNLGRRFNRMMEDLAHHEQQLQLSITEAQEANRTKSQFLSNMSHELRTPMHAILSYSEMGLHQVEKGNAEKLTKYFTNISVSGDRLLKLINGLLDFSKLEAGRLPMEFTPQDVARVIRDAQAELEPLFIKSSLTFTLTNNATISEATIDSIHIARVMINILSNAIRYSPHEADITATIDACHHNNGQALQISIANCGPRIPEIDLEYIFDPFFQSISYKNAGGTGLGLAICREIIQAHRGKIWAENLDPNGVKFCIIIPLAQPLSDEASHET